MIRKPAAEIAADSSTLTRTEPYVWNGRLGVSASVPRGISSRVSIDLNPASPTGDLLVTTLAVMPVAYQFRRLLPYLLQRRPHPQPQFTGGRAAATAADDDVHQMPRALPVMRRVMLDRLYDLAGHLTGHFLLNHLHALMRRSGAKGKKSAVPGNTLPHFMLGFLLCGHPDLTERPCKLITTGN